MKRLSRILVVLCVVAALSCERSAPSALKRTTLVRCISGDPPSLDPTTSTEENGLFVDEMILRPLVGIDAKRNPVPALAASWTVSPDGLTYEFRLETKYTWESGAPVTSDDVRFTIERVHDPKIAAPTWRAYYEDLASVETPDPTSVRVRFTKPYAERMYAFNLPIVSAAAFAKAKNPSEMVRKPVGSGPYRLEAWETNQKLKLVRREGKANDDAHYDEIVFRVIPVAATRYQAGLRGELDEFKLTRDQHKAAEANADLKAHFNILRVPQFIEVILVWNPRGAFLGDARVRMALAHAWAREDTAMRLYPPEGAALATGPYPAGQPENDPGLVPPKFDPAESLRLLEDAGWKPGPGGIRRKNGKKASIEMIYPEGQPIYPTIGEILRSAYEKVGVELVLRSLEWGAFAERANKGEFDVQFEGLTFFPPNLDPYPYFHSSQWPPNGQNAGFYKNAEADRVMEAARDELDPAKRLELRRQVARILAADPPGDFLFSTDQYWAVSKRVENVELSPFYGLFHFLPGPFGWRPAPADKR